MTFSDTEPDVFRGSELAADAPRWRARALDRSLEPARARSIDRLDRLVQATRELTNESGDAAFTVAQVAARAGLSLKSFYKCFAGKDEVLLALLEEESRTGAVLLAKALDRHDDPARRVRGYIDGLFELARVAPGYAGMLVREQRRLGADHPVELRAALAPFVELLAVEIEAAAARGEAEPGDPARAAEIVFELVVTGLAEVALAGRPSREVASSLWRFVAGGLRMKPAAGDAPANGGGT
jgi:AcrR family transcriptional regulator